MRNIYFAALERAGWSVLWFGFIGCAATTQIPQAKRQMDSLPEQNQTIDNQTAVGEEAIATDNLAGVLNEPNGKDHMKLAVDQYLPMEPEQFSATDPKKTTYNNEGQLIECVAQDITQTQIRQLVNTVALFPSNQVYPGNLLQGKYYARGLYAPITVPRAGGKLVLTGLVFSQGARYSTQVDALNQGSVQQSISDLLRASKVDGTAAVASFNSQQVFSSSQMNFSLGVDFRFANISMSNQFQIGQEQHKNYVLAQFTQVYYTVSVEDPETRYSFFRDGELFDDPDDEIAVGKEANPPLYISSVNYGRQVFFLVSSDYDARYLRNALNGAIAGLPGTTLLSVNLNLTYQDVLAHSEIAYFVIGSAADLALEPLKNASNSDKLYDALQKFITRKDAANFSPENPGVPISYNANFLASRSPAVMSYSTSFRANDCKITPRRYASFTFQFGDVDSDVHVWVDDHYCLGCNGNVAEEVFSSNASNVTFNLDRKIPADDQMHRVRVQLGNYNCAGAILSPLRLLHNNEIIFDRRFRINASDCGWQNNLVWEINRATGEANLVYIWIHPGSLWDIFVL